MSIFVDLFRKTASRVYKRKSEDDAERHPLQNACNLYSRSCFSLYQACIIGDVDAVRYYINVGHKDINEPDKDGCTALFYAIQKNRVVLVQDLIKAGADVNLMASLEEGIMVTPVHIAAKYNRIECLEILLEHGADANIANSFGQTPLHTAARRKLNEMVKILIKIGSANVNTADHDMVTALHLVATKGNPNERKNVAKTLLENGASPFSEDNEGNTVFHEAAENGVDDVLGILCKHRGKGSYSSIADVLNKPRKDGNNCLHLAVKNNHEKVLRMCIDNKADINKKSVNGDSPLHMACCTGNTTAGRILLENGADVNITDSQGFTIIHRAAAKGSIDCCTLLLKMGADIDTFHYCGTALILASRYKQHHVVKYLLDNGATPIIRNKMLDTCLHLAVKNADVETVKIIMEKCGDQLLELKDKYENTSLHLAARTGNEEVLKILLSYNPDIGAINDRGKCPIHVAAESGSSVKLLVQAEKCNVHVTDFMWRTPLHLACLSGNDLDQIKFLLDHGADPNARDDRRWTPLLYVATRGCACSTKLLVQYGAKLNVWDKNRKGSAANVDFKIFSRILDTNHTMTALSLAATNNRDKAVESLLNNGADPSILTSEGLSCMDIALNNRFHDVCMVIAKSDKWKEALVSNKTMESCLEASPEVAKVIFDKCIEYSGREIDKDYKITYNFELLDPPPGKDETYYGPLVMKLARRHDLLLHPLTKKLIRTNWIHGVRYIYYSQMILLAAALLFLTLFMWWSTWLMNLCYQTVLDEHIEDLEERNIATQNVSSIPYDSLFYSYNESFCYIKLQRNARTKYSEYRMITFQCLIFAYFLCYLGKEFNQMRLERWEYFLDITNYFDLSVSSLFLMFVQLPNKKPIPYCRLKFGIIGIFAYYFLMFLWSRGLSRFGIYITMFLEVLATLIKVVSAFLLLFVCFAVTFYVGFTTQDKTDFSTMYDSFLKVMAMTMGELDYTGLRDYTRSLRSLDMQIIIICVFLVFCITMSLVVNNLLIGLAVGDIELVRKNAEIKLTALQVNDIVDARSKMHRCILRRFFYVKTVTEMPNKDDCETDHRQKEYIRRKDKTDKNIQMVC